MSFVAIEILLGEVDDVVLSSPSGLSQSSAVEKMYQQKMKMSLELDLTNVDTPGYACLDEVVLSQERSWV